MRRENLHHWRCLGCPRTVCLLSFFVPDFSYGLDMECPYPLQPLPDVVHMYTDYLYIYIYRVLCIFVSMISVQCFFRCMMYGSMIYVHMHMSTIDFSQLPSQLRY